MTETITFTPSEVIDLIKSNFILKSLDIPDFEPMVKLETPLTFTFHLVKKVTFDEIQDFIKEKLVKIGKKDKYEVALHVGGSVVCTAILAPENPDDKMRILLKTKLVDLDLPVAVLNAFKPVGIETLAQLVDYNRQDLFKIRNFGKKGLTVIDHILAEKDLHFGMNIKKYGF